MCVIMYKPSNVKIDKTTLGLAWDSNPHGAGLAYFTHENKTQVIKGIMTLKALLKTMHCLQDVELVLHFRFATHGLKNRQQTHPFTVSKQVSVAKAMSFNGVYDNAFFHNGIIYSCGDNQISDTLDFTSRILAAIPQTKTRLAVLEAIDSHFAYMEGGKTYLIGRYEEYQGLSCSNTYFDKGFKPIARNYYSGNDEISTWEEDIGITTASEQDAFDSTMDDYFNNLKYKTR